MNHVNENENNPNKNDGILFSWNGRGIKKQKKFVRNPHLET